MFAFHINVIRIGCIVMILLIVELIRRDKLRENYALLWLIAAGILFVLCVFPTLIIALSRTLHLQYLSFVFGLSFVFLLLIVTCLSISMSKASEQIEKLAQENALLGRKLNELQNCKT